LDRQKDQHSVRLKVRHLAQQMALNSALEKEVSDRLKIPSRQLRT
jgi:hypothetical protein